MKDFGIQSNLRDSLSGLVTSQHLLHPALVEVGKHRQAMVIGYFDFSLDQGLGVAVVLEYLEQIKKNKRVPKVAKNDKRLLLFDEDGWERESVTTHWQPLPEPPENSK